MGNAAKRRMKSTASVPRCQIIKRALKGIRKRVRVRRPRVLDDVFAEDVIAREVSPRRVRPEGI